MSQVEIPSGTTVGALETMGRQWNIVIGYAGQGAFVLKARDINPFGDWEVLDEFDIWLYAYDAMLVAYNQYDDHDPKEEEG